MQGQSTKIDTNLENMTKIHILLMKREGQNCSLQKLIKNNVVNLSYLKRRSFRFKHTENCDEILQITFMNCTFESTFEIFTGVSPGVLT